MRVAHFTKCETCGTHGHSENRCPLHDLNEFQEKMTRDNRSLGLTAELAKEISNLRQAWKEDIERITCQL